MNNAIPRSCAQPLPLVIAATSLGFGVIQLDVSIVNVALDQIGMSLDAQVEALQWVVNAYTLAFACLLLSAGALGDRLGVRKVFMIGLTLFLLASLFCGLSLDITTLITARAAQGIGAALLMPCSLALLNHVCGEDKRARSQAMGVWAATGGMAFAAGPVLGGFLVDYWGWPSIFLVNLPICLVGIGLTWQFLDEPHIKSRHQGFDALGQGLSIATLFMATSAIIKAGTLGWDSTIVLVCLSLALVSGLAFILVEAHGVAPMLPLGFFRFPAFSVSILAGFCVSLSFYGVIFMLSFYFQQVKHYSTSMTGLAFLPVIILAPFFNIMVGRLTAQYGVRWPIIIGLLMASVGFALLTSINNSISYISLSWRLLLAVIGTAISIPPVITALLSAVPREQAGVASGVFNAVRQAASAIGVAFFGSLMAGSIVDGMKTAFLFSAAILALATILTVVYISHAPR